MQYDISTTTSQPTHIFFNAVVGLQETEQLIRMSLHGLVFKYAVVSSSDPENRSFERNKRSNVSASTAGKMFSERIPKMIAGPKRGRTAPKRCIGFASTTEGIIC